MATSQQFHLNATCDYVISVKRIFVVYLVMGTMHAHEIISFDGTCLIIYLFVWTSIIQMTYVEPQFLMKLLSSANLR